MIDQFNQAVEEVDSKKNELLNLQTITPFTQFDDLEALFKVPAEYSRAEVMGKCKKVANTGLYHIELTYESAKDFVEIMKRIITFILVECKMKNPSQTDTILRRLVEDPSLNENPDNLSSFKHYTKSNKNKGKAFFELYLHPATLITSIVNTPAQFFVRPFMKKKKDIDNLNKMNKFVYEDTLLSKQMVYQNIIRGCLIEYTKVAKLVKTLNGISFDLNLQKSSFGIEDVQRLSSTKYENITQSLRKMGQLMSSSKNSFTIFQTILRIYQSELIPEYRKNYWLNYSSKMVGRYNNGECISTLLNEIINHTAFEEDNLESSFVSESKIVALAALKYSISGTGSNANEMISLFGTIQVSANCVNDSFDIFIFEKSQINNINKRVKNYIIEALRDQGYELSDSLYTNEFVQEGNSYIQEKLKKLKKKISEMKDNLADNVSSAITNKNISFKNVYSGYDHVQKLDRKEQKLKYLNSLKSLLIWYETTNKHIDDIHVIGFQLNAQHIDDIDDEHISVDPITILF